jgi:hypothetical protein
MADTHSLKHPLAWTIVNLTVVLLSISLFLDIDHATDNRAERPGAIAEYLLYNFGTSVGWVFEVTPKAYVSWKNNEFGSAGDGGWIVIAESLASLYFVGDSIRLLIKWKLHRKDLDQPLMDAFVGIISYSYLTVESFQTWRKREYEEISQEPSALAV